VLLHAGHNHFADKHPVPTILGDTEAIIGTMREINPEVVVFLAQVIPSGKLPKYAYIPELNRRLAALAGRLGDKVILVNQADGFDWKTDTKDDKVHPNEAGAKKMARQWWKAIDPLVGVPAGNPP
jgi:lysophospholipase L1-like esterase